MESVEAFLRAIKMSLIVGLVVTAVHAVAIRPPDGDTRWQRAIAVMGDVVSWPRLFIEAGRTVGAARIDHQPPRYSMLPGSEGKRGMSP
jgi:hypothetical protein